MKFYLKLWKSHIVFIEIGLYDGDLFKQIILVHLFGRAQLLLNLLVDALHQLEIVQGALVELVKVRRRRGSSAQQLIVCWQRHLQQATRIVVIVLIARALRSTSGVGLI